MPIPSKRDVKLGRYPRTDNNMSIEKEALLHFGYPEDYMPEADEARNIMEAYLVWKEMVSE